MVTGNIAIMPKVFLVTNDLKLLPRLNEEEG
jgi:hypothetical protein